MVKAHIVTVLAGSLRTGSLNRAAAKVASEYLDDQATVNMPVSYTHLTLPTTPYV